MKKRVLLTLQGKQSYMDQEPEIIELVTEGTLESTADGWNICYEESDLTGLKGTTTVFEIAPDKIVLTRRGPLNSQMVFAPGYNHESLYQMEFGAMMITVCATKVSYDLSEAGGTVDLTYRIEIEQAAAGVIDYHLEVRPAEA